MAIGLKYGKAFNDTEDKKQETYSKTREFFNRFTELNGSVNCRVLLEGLDMNDPDDHKMIMERKLFELNCEKYVSDAVVIVDTI
jgi:C_GCAxxG_C_C family probable redox protein